MEFAEPLNLFVGFVDIEIQTVLVKPFIAIVAGNHGVYFVIDLSTCTVSIFFNRLLHLASQRNSSLLLAQKVGQVALLQTTQQVLSHGTSVKVAQ